MKCNHLLRRISLTLALLLLFSPGRGHAQGTLRLSDAMGDLAQQLTSKLQHEQKRQLAILPFVDLDGQATKFGKYVSEELVTRLFELGGFQIIERNLLDRLVGEIKLNDTGLVDPQTAQKVRTIAGVDSMVTGTVTDLRSYLTLNCRVIDTLTGKVFAVARVQVIKDADVAEIMQSRSVRESPPMVQPVTVPPAPKSQVAHAADFTFTLQGCTRSGASLLCELMVTNDINDRPMSLVSARLVDQGGNEISAARTQLGSGEGSRFSTANRNLVNGVPTRAILQFSGLSDAATEATLLEVEIYSADQVRVGGFSGHGSNGRTTVKFRHIAFVSR